MLELYHSREGAGVGCMWRVTDEECNNICEVYSKFFVYLFNSRNISTRLRLLIPFNNEKSQARRR